MIRYGLTVLLVITVPPAFLWWFIIHPLAPRLRAFGPARILMVMIPLFVGVMVGLFQIRGVLVGQDLAWNPLLFAIGVVFYAMSTRLELRIRRHLTFRILAGVPELAGDGTNLLTEGIYAHLRHPRYLAVLIGVLGFALMVNYSGAYVMFGVSVIGIAVTIWLEERELLSRFGERYREYRAKVPAIIPNSLDFMRDSVTRGGDV